MKKVFLFTSILVFVMVGSVSALTYTDTYTDRTYMRINDTISWTFDITEDDFNPNTEDIESASVALNFTDDRRWDFWEFATLDVGSNTFLWEVDTGDVSFTLTSLMTLSDSGTIDASLTAIFGDFYFNSATLTADSTLTAGSAGSAPAPVPEPSTMILMGLGLAGLVGYNRKRFNKKS